MTQQATFGSQADANLEESAWFRGTETGNTWQTRIYSRNLRG